MLFEHTLNFILSAIPACAVAITLLLALLLDKILGEARNYHYLVGFGWLAQKLEKKFNINHTKNSRQPTEPLPFNKKSALLGALAWSALVLPIPVMYVLCFNHLAWYWQIPLDAFILYLALGLNSLNKHAMQVYRPLNANDLENARHFTGYLVSRNTKHLTPAEMSRATVESMLENGHDSVIASMVYYLIGGAPLVILHRFANTLDAMWGYKTPRFNSFGYASARLDDILGFIPAKICTLLYVTQGCCKQSIVNAYQQGNRYKSHNGGWVMAAGATVLNRKLGGSAQYNGQTITSVTLGCGEEVNISDIPKSVQVVQRAAIQLAALVCLWQLLFFMSS